MLTVADLDAANVARAAEWAALADRAGAAVLTVADLDAARAMADASEALACLAAEADVNRYDMRQCYRNASAALGTAADLAETDAERRASLALADAAYALARRAWWYL